MVKLYKVYRFRVYIYIRALNTKTRGLKLLYDIYTTFICSVFILGVYYRTDLLSVDTLDIISNFTN